MAGPKLNAVLGLDNKEFTKGLKEAEGSVSKFGDSLRSMAAAAGVALGVREIIRFSAEAVKLAGKLEGIKGAFDRLNNPMLLSNLRSATNNTVSDINLMSAAVRANNFRIALDQLPRYFEFAARRAKETGENVDYLVDSLVMGIGRKSAMILDNLGISLSDINEELKKTPDYATAVGNIIDREMKKSGSTTKTTADYVAEMNAQWENLKITIGGLLVRGGVGGTVGSLSEGLNVLNTLFASNKTAVDEATVSLWRYKQNLAVILGALAQGISNKRQQKKYGYMLPTATIMAGGPPEAGEPTASKVETDIFGPGYTEALLEASAAWDEFKKTQIAAAISSEWVSAASLSQIENINELAAVVENTTSIVRDFSDISNTLTGVFGEMFYAGIHGWNEFGKAAINAIQQMLIQLAALAATYAVLSLIPGFSQFVTLSGGFVNFMSQGMGFGSTNGIAGTVNKIAPQAMTLRTEVSGSNLAVILARGNNSINGDT